MDEMTRYNTIDMPFYRAEIAPRLPSVVLDFHAHIWQPNQWKTAAADRPSDGARYMVTDRNYPVETLLADGRRLFPDRSYEAVCFGYPTPAVDRDATNRYVAEAARNHPALHPLLVIGRDHVPPEQIEQTIRDNGYLGYKVFLDWLGDDYGSITIPGMLGEKEMRVADRLGLIVLWHVPGSRRLADPRIQSDLCDYARRFPNARIVAAHGGRCYLPEEMRAALPAIRDIPNIYFDTSMVMDPLVLQMAFEALGPGRILFATDLPVAIMRGRRVQVLDHWVDVVLEGYAPSAFRVASNGIRATFMVYEIVRAILRAGEMAGLSENEIASVFYANGKALLDQAGNRR